MALKYSGIAVELREVALSNKPRQMLTHSPKGTVPVLVLADQTVIEESRDIMLWALAQHDPAHWQHDSSSSLLPLLETNDGSFKHSLDRYKYADRFPEHSMAYYREQGEVFLQQLNTLLAQDQYLAGQSMGMVDVAIFPFIRQFAHVDKTWFYQSTYHALQRWLDSMLALPLFEAVMHKYTPWQTGDDVTVL